LYDSLQSFKDDQQAEEYKVGDYQNTINNNNNISFASRLVPNSPQMMMSSPPRSSFNQSRTFGTMGSGRWGEDENIFNGSGGLVSPYPPPLGSSSTTTSTSFKSGKRVSQSPVRSIGASVWGSNTPISKKGKLPSGIEEGGLENGCWYCPVCFYMENPPSTSVCEICESSNPKKRGEFQLRHTCPQCLFENGEFALKCEMCGSELYANNNKGKKGGRKKNRVTSQYDDDDSDTELDNFTPRLKSTRNPPSRKKKKDRYANISDEDGDYSSQRRRSQRSWN